MESYDEFIQGQVTKFRSIDSQVLKSPLTSHASSVIRFYGCPILPVLPSKEQREQMQRLREAALTLTKGRSESSTSPTSYIQNVLDSVQLRKAPTLLEFLNEPAVSESLSNCQVTYNPGCPDEEHADISESLWNPLPISTSTLTLDWKIVDSGYPLTSTTCDGLAGNNVKSLQNEEETLESSEVITLCEVGTPSDQQKQRAMEQDTSTLFRGVSSETGTSKHSNSHQALSSGYVTNENTDATSQASWMERVEVVESMRVETEICSLFGGDTHAAQTSKRGQDIISHAPVEGEDLEEESALVVPSVTDAPIIAEAPTDSDTVEGPYRMSLQKLLKKSQEYRRRQRQLRNLSKSSRASQARQEDERNLSDKENEEFQKGGDGKAEPRRVREKRGEQGKGQFTELQTPSMDGPIQTHADEIVLELGQPNEIVLELDQPNEIVLELGQPNESVGNTEQVDDHSADLASVRPPDITDTVLPSDCPTAEALPAMLDNLPQLSSEDAPLSAKSIFRPKDKRIAGGPLRPGLAVKKSYKKVPTPQFCLSPVRSKKDGSSFNLVRKRLVSTALCADAAGGALCSCPGARHSSRMPSFAERSSPLLKSTEQREHIAQLEMNLSSLKALISDLESTLTDAQPDCRENRLSVASEAEPASLQGHQTPLPEGPGDSVCAEALNLSPIAVVGETVQLVATARQAGQKQQAPARSVTSLVQRMRVPDAFRNITDSQQRASVLVHANHSEERVKEKERLDAVKDSLSDISSKQCSGVDTPCGQWLSGGSRGPQKQLTPEGEAQQGLSRAKRRLVMHAVEKGPPAGPDTSGTEAGPAQPSISSSSIAAVLSQAQQQQRLQQDHQAQLRELMEEQRRQQHELLQCLTARYQFLQSVSLPRPGSRSRLEDAPTSLRLLPPSSPGLDSPMRGQADVTSLSDTLNTLQHLLPASSRPLVAAAVKGYLTRRLLRTERVAQLLRTIKDTQQFLVAFQPQTPSRTEYSNRQELILVERVALQLRSARYELQDLFFSLAPRERMQLIRWDRELAKERELKQQGGTGQRSRGMASISAATRKALERKRSLMSQRNAPEKTKSPGAVQDGWALGRNPHRIPRRTSPSYRPR